jgi:hypothetical protein
MNYIMTANEYTPEFKILMISTVLKYNFDKKKAVENQNPITVRTKNTVGMHNDMSPGVIGSVQEQLRNEIDSNLLSIYMQFESKAYMNLEERKALANKYVVEKTNDGYWLKFPQNGSDEVVNDLNLVAKETHQYSPNGSWCTGGALGTAKSHNKGGDFYIFVDNNYNTRLAARYDGTDKLEELRGLGSGQSIETVEDNERANYFTSKYKGGEKFKKNIEFNQLVNKYIDISTMSIKPDVAPNTIDEVNKLLNNYKNGDGGYNQQLSDSKIDILRLVITDNEKIIIKLKAKELNVKEEEVVLNLQMASKNHESLLKDVNGNFVIKHVLMDFVVTDATLFTNLKTVGGDVNLIDALGDLNNLISIGGEADFTNWDGEANALVSIGGNAYFIGWTGSANALTSIGGNTSFQD